MKSKSHTWSKPFVIILYFWFGCFLCCRCWCYCFLLLLFRYDVWCNVSWFHRSGIVFMIIWCLFARFASTGNSLKLEGRGGGGARWKWRAKEAKKNTWVNKFVYVARFCLRFVGGMGFGYHTEWNYLLSIDPIHTTMAWETAANKILRRCKRNYLLRFWQSVEMSI